MQENKINRQIVESARVFGQWLNQIAQTFSENEIAEGVEKRADKVCQVKAKILREFENIAMRSLTPQDVLYGLSRRAGQLVQTDVPGEATLFIDAVMSGDGVSAHDALQMIITYMRLGHEQKNGHLPRQANAERS